MSKEDMIFEAIKLLTQFVGALFIAWRTVQWALKRYKQEKHWERKLSAYTDVVMALTNVLEVLGTWEAQELNDGQLAPERIAELQKRYRKARETLDEARGIAMLLLSKKITDGLNELSQNLYKNDVSHVDFFTQINAEWEIVSAARDSIVLAGRRDLDITAR